MGSVWEARGRRGDAVTVRLDFSEAIVVPFDPETDRVEDVRGRGELLRTLVREQEERAPR